MLIFSEEQLLAIRKIAEKYGVNEFQRDDRKGIFYDPRAKILIDSQHSSDQFKGLPMIGISNLISTDENAGSIIEEIRSDIIKLFDELPKKKEKFQPKVIHDSEKDGTDYVVKKEEAIIPKASESKPEQPKPEKIVPCYICGFEVPHADVLDFLLDEIPLNKMKHRDCVEPIPTKTEVMLPKSKPVVSREPARIPVKVCTPLGTMIKGFTPSLIEIGKIKIGKLGALKVSQSGKEYRIPEKLNHFEITSIIRDTATGAFFQDPIMNVLGTAPTELDIQLLFNDPALNFLTSYGYYQGGKCMCRGDGGSAKMIDGSTVQCDPDTCQNFLKKKCKPNGILSVILSKSPRLGGVYKFRTTSINSIRSILSSMFFLATQTGGVLSMIPLKLTLSPKQVTPVVNGVPTPTTIYVANIEYAGTVESLLNKTIEVQTYQSKMRENLVRLEATARNILTAPEPPEEQREFQEEFYPGTDAEAEAEGLK
jgi:hypothetical protein